MTDQTAPSQTKLDTATRLAFERTRVSYDRTVMAGVRTATSLITFGFTIYKFFQLEMIGRDRTGQLIGPREFALTMIGIGLLSLLFATLEYRRDRKQMRAQYPGMPRSTAGVAAALVAALGILALLVVIIRG